MTALGYGTQLFIDDLLIHKRQGLTRTLHPATKLAEPVLSPEPGRPWEHDGPLGSKRVFLLGTVLFDKPREQYRMWYMTRLGPDHGHRIPGLYMPRPGRGAAAMYDSSRTDVYGRTFADNDRGDLTCYAESEDGIHWTRPNLGVFQFDRNPDNNIVWDLHGTSVFLNEDESDPQRRYKAIGFCRRYRNIFLLTSPDGIHWSDKGLTEPVMHRSNEGPCNVVYDREAGLYRAYMTTKRGAKDLRHIEYSESERLEGPWTAPRLLLYPGPEDDALGKARYGAIRAEFHNMSGCRYGNMYVGILGALYVRRDQEPALDRATPDGPIDAQLVHSRDGVKWHLFEDRSPVLPRGGPGSFDECMILFTGKEPLVEEDQVHWYYTGSDTEHGARVKDKLMSIGRATWRLDGFVSLDAGSEGGVLETVPLQVPDGRLEVNADADGGTLAIEVLFPDGQVQPGFSARDCALISGDDVRHLVRWSQGGLSAAQRPLRLRFALRHARLYSFRLLPWDR